MKYFRLVSSVLLGLTVPAFATVTVTVPKAGSTVTSPVQYVATSTTSTCAKGVASMGIYVNNKLTYVVNGNKLNTSMKLNTGAEHTVVEEWDKCGKATYSTINLTVTAATKPTSTISANPQTISAGGSSVLTVTATNATQLTVAGTDGTSYVLPVNGGMTSVTPTVTTTYTATATGNGSSVTSQATVTVGTKSVTSISIAPGTATFAMGTTQQFSATATYNDKSTADVTSAANWTVANTAVATISSAGLATGEASGTTSVTESLNGVSGNAGFTVTIAPGTGVSIPTWHVDANRSGLNANEQSLSTSNVSAQTFGKLFSYLVDGYAYAEPLLVSNLTINGNSHNVLFVATEKDSVYAFDADNYSSGAPLWKVSLLQNGETPSTGGPILPFEGVTSTPVIDISSNTIYVLSKQTSSGVSSFRLNALDITSGAQKFGGPVTISASVKGTNSSSVNGVDTLTTSCTQRAALLLAYGNVYIGFGSCHSGWLLAYDAQTLAETGVFNSSPNLNGEGTYASAGGVWMGSGGPVADGAGNVYVTTGNGPWDGQTAFADSVLKFNSTLQLEDYFTPQDYQYMDCNDADLAAGGLILIPGTSQLLGGGKTGKLFLVNSGNMGHEQAGDAGATQTLFFESDLSSPYSSSCTDSLGTHTTYVNSYEIFGTSAYFNGAVYLGVTPTSSSAPAGVRRFTYSGTLSAGSHTSLSIQQNTRGTTPFISANNNSNGILWMIDTGLPLQSSGTGAPTTATLHAFDALDLSTELYSSATNSADAPGYGIKFSSPVVANAKVYISTGHDQTTISNPQGEIDVYGLH